jgi:GT2 family glycosyltransferase
MPGTPNSAIIIPVHNGEPVLAACLSAALTQQPSPIVIAVENGSSDASATLIAQQFPQVRLLTHPAPLGFAGAINLGLRAALALPEPPGLLTILNQDTVVDPGWLAALAEVLATDPEIGVVGSMARYGDGSPQHAGAELVSPRWYGRNRLRAHDPVSGEPFISFLGVGLRPALIQAVGLLDDAYAAGYYEDADYCLRAVAAGWRLSIAAGATLIHHEGAISQQSYRHAALIERNRIRTILKHYPLDQLGQLWEAERAALIGQASQGSSQVLRQAYLHGLVQLPEIARARAMDPAQQRAVASQLTSLRDQATRRERTTRGFGLGQGTQQTAIRMGGLADPPHGPATHMGGLGYPSREPAPTPQVEELQDPVPGVEQQDVAALPLIAIIMLTWNGLDVTRACIESIRAHTDPRDYQLIVVDNGSTDGTLEWLRAQPELQLIANPTNLGFTHGNNQGMAAAPDGYDLLLLNNDTQITQGHWLRLLREVAHSHPRYGIVGCTLLHSNGLLQHAGTAMPDSLWGYQIGGGERYVGQYLGVREVEGITGACMYIRRDCYAAIGGLDPGYFSYYEDSDYCLRAQQAGYAVVCTGDVQIVHHENTSSRLNRSDWQAMFSAGRQRFSHKWRDHYDNRYTRRLLWHSLFALPTGYATSSREIVRELDRRQVDVRAACIFGTDYTEPPTGDPRIDQLRSRPKDLCLPQVVYSQADAFVKNGGRVKIGFTMHETDRLPEDWVRQCNAMDEVWTPTHWGIEVFQASGVTRPIHAIPLGFNPDYFHPQIHGRKPSNRYTFLSVFDWIERKAPDLLLHAYLKTFQPTDDVLLILKVSNTDPHFDLRRAVAELVGSGPTPPITLLVNQKIAPAELGVLYRSADCFVLPTRGEGWGMPTLEAMACGLPVISTGWGAQSEFLHNRIGYPLAIDGVAPAVTRSPYYAGTNWAVPSLDHLCDLMRYVYSNPEAARATGERAAAEVHARWTWGHAAEKIIARLDAFT